jgi:hypothetical protein
MGAAQEPENSNIRRSKEWEQRTAISLLTFIGNTTKQLSTQLSIAFLLFGLGALSATLIFVLAYIAQLHYGNAEVEPSASNSRILAKKWHGWCYVLLVFSILFFLGGLATAACGLKHN